MSEGVEQGVEQPSAGTLLRRAREASGLHVAALAVSLKVPVRKLEALEADRLDELPDAVFVRALASSVCRTLKIDPQPVLDRLPQTTRPRLIQDRDGINAPFRAPSDGVAPAWHAQLSKPVVLVVFALLLAAVVLVFLPTRRDDAQVASADPAPTAVPVVIPGPAVEPAPASVVVAPASPTLALSPSRALPAAVTPTDSTPNVLSPTSVQSPSAAVARAAASAPLPAASAAALPPATGTVVFRTTGQSWVQVTDAKGVVTLRRLMEAGETAGASGTPPLAVTVGSANKTRVDVRGNPFDLAPVSNSDNVARFEVK